MKDWEFEMAHDMHYKGCHSPDEATRFPMAAENECRRCLGIPCRCHHEQMELM